MNLHRIRTMVLAGGVGLSSFTAMTGGLLAHPAPALADDHRRWAQQQRWNAEHRRADADWRRDQRADADWRRDQRASANWRANQDRRAPAYNRDRDRDRQYSYDQRRDHR